MSENLTKSRNEHTFAKSGLTLTSTENIMPQGPYEIIEEIQHCIKCARDIHDCAAAQRICEDCIIEGL